MTRNRRVLKARWQIAGVALLLQACAADPRFVSNSSNTNPVAQQQAYANTLQSGKVVFRFDHFYSLTSPYSASNCAGDAKTFFDPLLLSGSNPAPMQTSLGDSTSTIRPGFIKNVSVDLTDSNANVPSNLASSCSYGNGLSSPPVTHCATFDYGAVGGIPTSMGGALLLIGGIQGYNYSGVLPAATQVAFPFHSHTMSCGPTKQASTLTSPVGFNACNKTMYALAVDTLPASTATNPPSALAPGLTSASGPISTWANLAGASNYTGPSGVAGASAAYSSGAQKLILFGGASPLSGTVPTGPGITTYESWAYDLKVQKWTQLNANIAVDLTMLGTWDYNAVGNPSFYQLSKAPGARSLFGYVSAPGMALRSMSADGATVAPYLAGLPNSASNIDHTDRIMIVGGVNTGGGLTDTLRFNPTFGPDYVDTLNANSPLNVPAAPAAARVVQWIDSYHTQIMHNSHLTNVNDSNTTTALYRPDFTPAGSRNVSVSFGLVPLRHNASTKGAGYLLAAGGFDNSLLITTPAQPAGLMVNRKRGATVANSEDFASNYSAVTNLPDIFATQNTPSVWLDVSEPGIGGATVPWYGGVSMVPGFNLETNDVVYFGGADCSQYLTNVAAACTSFANPGRYWQLTSNPNTYLLNGGGSYVAPANVGFGATTPPARAGMAVARGADPSGNVLIVAWGGMSAAATATDTNIYFLYNSAALPAVAPRWGTYTPAVGSGPTVYGNAAMVYSHITKKFYLFGGYSPLTGLTSSDTWELSVVGPANCGVAGGCQFAWKQLNTPGGLTCHPTTCPQGRRSHRITEVNYYNRNPGGAAGTAGVAGYRVDGEPVCTSSSTPCSFGIFMEGGTPDGVNVIADRWMFDPTANGGIGHWQKVGELPPRALASMAAADYYVPSTQQKVHRAILFGGETGLHSTGVLGSTTGYFVAPTLGDTYMYDFDNNTWNKVTLLGKGYNIDTSVSQLGTVAGTRVSGVTEFEARQAYSALDNTAYGRNLAELTPPPLAGAIMVTRTFSGPTLNAQSPVPALKIPEVYLFGGRTKSGHYNTLDKVYKFCAGSSGEKPYNPDGGAVPRSQSGVSMAGTTDDASCDAYDATSNSNSQAPVSGYVGRWMRKTPTGAGPAAVALTDFGSFMGAGTYDPVRDRIVLIGGLRPRPGTGAAITDLANNTPAIDPVGGDSSIYALEYTPPSRANPASAAAELNGTWTAIRNCTGFTLPVGRYGHSVGFDALNQQIIVSGGYDSTGTALVQNMVYYDGRTYQIPEVWTAKRIDSTNAPAGFPAQIPALSTTNPCYYWVQKTTFGNSIDFATQSPPTTGMAHAASVYIPSSGFNTGYYTMNDKACIAAGPIASTDPSVNKLLAGGVYFDIDRSVLGSNENLLLNLTLIPFGTKNQNPDTSTLTQSESAYIRIHLMKTGQTGDLIRTVFQPRFLAYSAEDLFPKIAETISIVAPPTGQIRQEQVFLPISMDPAIDRIRVERYSGSGIIIDASLYRLGNR